MNNWCILLVGFSRIFLLRILIFKGLTARRLYKSFGVKRLTHLHVLIYTCWLHSNKTETKQLELICHYTGPYHNEVRI
jgi:hypothetical protein